MCARRWACRWSLRRRSSRLNYADERRSKTRFKRSVGGDSCVGTCGGIGCEVGSRAEEERGERFPFAVSLGGLYEGPLDLLLDLIRKQDIDIYDIPIAKITAQYLAYVEKIRELDVNVAAEFIYMAA